MAAISIGNHFHSKKILFSKSITGSPTYISLKNT